MSPSSAPVIRRLDRSDIAACATLFLDVFNGPPWNEDWTPEVATKRVADCFDTPGFHGWGTEQDGRLAALALGYCEPYNRQVHYYLKEMCVHPTLQRRGIGRALMTRLMTDLQSAGVHRVYLLTARDGDAEAFYRGCGFYVSPRMVMMGRRMME